MARPFRRPTRQITETVHGVDVAYDVPDTTPVIRLPFNLDAALRRSLFALAIAMTVVAIVWGTVAIGSMLTLLAPPWAAYLVAGVFDAGWAACLVAEWLLRYDSKRAEIPMRVGAAMLTVSMAAIITHGALAGPWGWTIGIIGALVSAAAKGVWAIGMHTIRIKLEPRYEAYLNARRQKAGTEMALALGERDRLLVEDSAVKLRLALEAQRPKPPAVEAEPAEPAPAELAEPVELTTTSVQIAPQEPAGHGARATAQPFGFHARATAQSEQRAVSVTKVAELLADDPGITSGQVSEELGVSLATAKRYLREARQAK